MAAAAETMRVRYQGVEVKLTWIRGKGEWFGQWGPERIWLKPALLASYFEKGWVVKV